MIDDLPAAIELARTFPNLMPRLADELFSGES
jgi:hypothetical protein